MKEKGEHDGATDEEALTKDEIKGYERKHGGKMPHHKRASGGATPAARAAGGGIAGRANGGAAPVAGRKHGGGIHPNPMKRPGHGNRHEHHGRAEGGGVPAVAARKHGGHVPGKHSEHRPDRRARGGATSDMNPLTSAGKMSSQPYERDQQPKADEGMKGADRRD